MFSGLQITSATLTNGELSFTMNREDIARLERLADLPDFLTANARERFALDMARRAVWVETGEPVVEAG